MALPFIAGLAVGAGATLLFTKRRQIKESLKGNLVGVSLQKGFNESLSKGRIVSDKALQGLQSGLEKTAQALKKLESKQEIALKTRKPRKIIKAKQESKSKE